MRRREGRRIIAASWFETRKSALTMRIKSGSPMKIDLNGRCAIVTGGAAGLGAVTGARRHRREGRDLGSATSRLPRRQQGNRLWRHGIQGRGDLAAVENTRRHAQALGKIDILVSNAGIAGINKTVWETDSTNGARSCASTDGPFIAARRSYLMVKQNYGRIVTLLIAGKEGNPTPRHYSPRRPA
jgi:3-oxoacyl-[acyl-carrier protein] reductase